MKLALSLLCENPSRKTGLTSLFHEFVEKSLLHEPELRWVVFVGPNQEWNINDDRVMVVRDYPANDRLAPRLWADHFLVAGRAAEMGAEALVTVGFVPLRRAGLPVAMHMLSLQHLQPANRVGLLRAGYRKAVSNYGLWKADLVITNTKFAISQILGVRPDAKEKIVQSYEGLQHEQFRVEEDPGEVDRLKKEVDVEPGYLFWCSNFYPYKQADLLLEAYARLEGELQSEMPIVMVGGGDWGGGLETAMARAKVLGIEDRVRHLGWIPDDMLGPLYRQARVFCLPSREETFGRCVLEAMACGTPCIVNSIPVMDEVTDGSAVVVNFQDVAAATEGLRRIACDEGLRRELIAGGLERARDFSFEKLAAERIEAIRRLLRSEPAAIPAPIHGE